ncbi:hypothetical protein MKW94_030904 [Papaver nudicaule]|uniref:Cytochrome P450 n=1 Tax=Papaver nudicaule TaxID=74823 RepID=A0AA41VY59_PAPNU|nr:hypothetical protein [Papaver nudicaule]
MINNISLCPGSLTSLTNLAISTKISFIIFASILLVLIIKFGFNTCRKPPSMSTNAPLPPGPAPWPIVGCVPKLLRSKPAMRWILSLMAEMNTEIACIRLGKVHVIPVTSPELAREFFRKNDERFAQRPKSMGTEYMSHGYLTTVFTPLGDQWKKMKRIMTSELISPARLHWLLVKRTEEAKNLVYFVYNQCTKKSASGGGVVDLRMAIRQYAGNVVRKMVFNRRYFGQGREDGGPGLEEVEQVDAIFTGLSLCYAFCISDYLPYLRWFDFQGHEKMMKKTMKIFNKYHDPIIDQRIRQRRNTNDKLITEKKEPEDLLDVLISLKADGKPLLSTEEIRAQITELFYVAVDNPSNAVEWALAEMINQPDILRKAVEEIDLVVGKERLVQESDLPKLNYMKACAREALRLHPLTSFNIPHMSTADAVVGGYSIPKGSHVMLSRYGLGRNARIWDEPLKFKPERHLRMENGSLANVELAEPDLRFISFSSGRRGCVAIPIGSAMTNMLLATLLQAFDWSAPLGDRYLIDLSESVDDHSMSESLLAQAKPRLPLCIYTME